MEPELWAKLTALQRATGWTFKNPHLAAKSMTAAHRDGIKGTHSEGNRDMARSGIEVINRCIRARSQHKHDADWEQAQTVYKRFCKEQDLIQAANDSGIISCIAHSPRQATPQPRAITFAMRALIFAVYEDSGHDIDAVCNLLDNLAEYLHPPIATPAGSDGTTQPIDTPQSDVETDSPMVLEEQLYQHNGFGNNSLPSNEFASLFDDVDSGNVAVSFHAEEPALESDWSFLDVHSASSYVELFEQPPNFTPFDLELGAIDSVDESTFLFPNDVNSDVEMHNAPNFPQGGSDDPQQACAPSTQSNKRKKQERLPSTADLEKYLNKERSRALQTTDVQRELFKPFHQVFSQDSGCFNQPGTMWKLLLAPTSSQTVVSVKRALAASDQLPHNLAKQPEFDLQFHYRMINQIFAKSASNIIHLRYHIYQFYISQRESSQGALGEVFINQTDISFSQRPVKRPGNPLNKQKSLSDERLVQQLHPNISPDSEEYKRAKNLVRSFSKTGERLDNLVRLFNRGILCLLPFPGIVDMDHNCLSMELNELQSLREDEFRAVLSASRKHSALLNRFCKAAEPVLDIITGTRSRQEYGFRMEYTDEAQLISMAHGSEELLSQFDCSS